MVQDAQRAIGGVHHYFAVFVCRKREIYRLNVTASVPNKSITWIMQTSMLEPALHGTDVANDKVPSGLRVIILTKKVWVGRAEKSRDGQD